MNYNKKDLKEKEHINSPQNYIYKCPSCELPKLIISNSESSNSTRFDTSSRKIPKRVAFNNRVTVVNIQSHKKYLRKQNRHSSSSVFEEEFYNDNSQNCVNCIIF